MTTELAFSPAARRDYTDAGIKAVETTLRRGRLSVVFGRDTFGFENAFARFLGVGNAVAVSSGTAALELALQCLGIGLGDEVVVPAYTFPATAASVLRNFAVARFADIDPATWNVSLETVKAAVTERTRAILVAHMFGNPADVAPVVEFARARGIAVIEDCAQAFGATIDGRQIGTFGDISIFSFNEIKNLSTGEGGMIVTADDDIAERCRLLRLHAARNGVVIDLGTKCTMTEMEAALGKALLKQLPAMNARRTAIGDAIAGRIGALPGIHPQQVPAGGVHVYSRFVFTLDEADAGISRADLTAALAGRGFHAQPVYPLPIYRNGLFVDLSEGRPTPGLAATYRAIYENRIVWADYLRLDLAATEAFCRTHLGFILTDTTDPADGERFADALAEILAAN
ncbi:MAG: DegT/DnrJ/EryC1/StrS family aminotransferase [Hyphomicrobiales bacterium]